MDASVTTGAIPCPFPSTGLCWGDRILPRKLANPSMTTNKTSKLGSAALQPGEAASKCPDTQPSPSKGKRPEGKKRKVEIQNNEKKNTVASPHRERLLNQSIWAVPVSYSPYLVLKTTDGSSLSGQSCFKIAKELNKKNVHKIVDVKKQRDGSLLLQTCNKGDSDTLLECVEFLGLPVQVTPHNSLNTSKGVVKHREFRDCTEEEMEGIDHVLKATQIIIKKNGTEVKTNTWVLVFDMIKCPSSITAAYIKNIPVRPYVPKPMRCFTCQRFGHTSKNCTRKQTCKNCGSDEHSEQCDKPTWCPNCRAGGHTASSSDCPKYVENKNILEYRAYNGGTFAQVRDILFPGGTTYASIVKKGNPPTSISSSSPLSLFPLPSSSLWGPHGPSTAPVCGYFNSADVHGDWIGF